MAAVLRGQHMLFSVRPGFVGQIIAMLVILLGVGQARADAHSDYLKAQTSFHNGEYAKAAEWLQKAVAKGHKAAQLPLAAMYREGQGVDQDYAQAVRLFSKAAKQGYPSAQFSLAVMYRLGQGVKRDYGIATTWYRKAARQGDAEAQNSLGAMYEYGRGVRSNLLLAHMWYEVAEANGNDRGHLNRKRLAKKLKPPELLESKKLSLACLNGNYRNCN